MPALQLPATSQTGPEGMRTALPLVAVDWVKMQDAPAQGVATPEVASLAVKPAVWVPRHQPGLPDNEQLSAAELRTIVGGVVSMVKVAVLLEPAAAPVLLGL